jgi:NAD(P)-dependent dehydrogenase (short-subunit alcohol dehydrogenase family)
MDKPTKRPTKKSIEEAAKKITAISSERFKGQVAIVVGGAQGIGKAIAVRLRREGAHVVVADIDRAEMSNLSRDMANAGTSVETVVCDVRRKRQIERMVAGVVQRHRRIDILMYVAGVAKSVPFVQTSEDLWDSTMDINLKGAFLTARAVAPYMIKNRRGKIIFMASTNSWDAEAELAPYNASKAALFLLAKTMARELGHHNIQSNAIGPGLIRTRLTEPFLKDPKFMSKYKKLIPAGRLGLPDDIAGPAAFLASSDADYINGVLLFVDGGQLA